MSGFMGIGLLILAYIGLFAAEALTPLGFAHGSLYVLLLLLAGLSGQRRVVLASAGLALLATLAGILISPPDLQLLGWGGVLANRSVSMLIIVIIAILMLHMQNILRKKDQVLQALEAHAQLLMSSKRLEQQLLTTLETMSDAFFMLDRDWRFTYINRQAEIDLQCRRKDIIGAVVWDCFPEAKNSEVEDCYRDAVTSGESRSIEFYFHPLKTWFEAHAHPDDNGLAVFFHNKNEQRAAQEKLRQSSHLESVGRLTGGIAHDFNNLLTVILGNAELIRGCTETPEIKVYADSVVAASQTGTDLTRRLLAYAQQQTLAPRATNISQLVQDMELLLQRTLGDDIDLEITRGEAIWQALVDPSQLQSALLNLALNARDAMPGGGRLAIDIANSRLDSDNLVGHPDVKPGHYLELAITDTGSGMDRETLKRVFEPFYTTKPEGKGTGLGLPMVYGFIKQSGGHITVYSEPGRGTTLRVYLPKALGSAVSSRQDSNNDIRLGGSERVLLTEDDSRVRQVAAGQLKMLGYQVTEAANGTEALQILEQGTYFDLLFTDVVMPGGIDGPELARRARLRRPQLKVLFTSGYTANAMVRQGQLESGAQLLCKPYRWAELAKKVRSVLDGPD